MPASQRYINSSTPLGANLVAGGATFAVWAPAAQEVSVVLDGQSPPPGEDSVLVRNGATGRWTGFLPGVVNGTRYRFYVTGPGGSGLKRDPRARELADGYPDCDCIVVDPDAYPWHDEDFRPPASDELVVYQLHVGVYYSVDASGHDLRPKRSARFLDALGRVAYLADLGVNAVQPLPVVEFHGEWSLGYNGTDLFSPERDYTVPDSELPGYLEQVNAHLRARGKSGLTRDDLSGQAAQLKAFVDVCHLYGLAVIFDVVYNHAGGDLDSQSIDHFDFPAHPDETNSIYFSDRDLAGGRIFAFDRPGVREFLIGNAEMLLAEYHGDGLRFDEVTVIDANGGWSFCQEMTSTLRSRHPDAVLIAEYWGQEPWLAIEPPPAGMGFHLGYADGLRNAVRSALEAAEAGASAAIDLEALAAGLTPPEGRSRSAQAYNCIENHDLVLDADGDHRYPRIPRLADTSDSRSWYARSRSRLATTALLTAAGTPQLFMGQELLEDKLWSDDPHRTDHLVWWGSLSGDDRHAADFRRFTSDLLAVRRQYAALRSNGIAVHLVDDANRVIAFHRWVPGVGEDVVVVLSLREQTLWGNYEIGMPGAGVWHEVFNSDYYDSFPNPAVAGNDGGVTAGGPPMHGLPSSARLTIPANGALVFAYTSD